MERECLRLGQYAFPNGIFQTKTEVPKGLESVLHWSVDSSRTWSPSFPDIRTDRCGRSEGTARLIGKQLIHGCSIHSVQFISEAVQITLLFHEVVDGISLLPILFLPHDTTHEYMIPVVRFCLHGDLAEDDFAGFDPHKRITEYKQPDLVKVECIRIQIINQAGP